MRAERDDGILLNAWTNLHRGAGGCWRVPGYGVCIRPRMQRVVSFFLALLVITTARAANLRDAFYDAEADQIVVDIVYSGTRDDHDFRIEWGKCDRNEDGLSGVAARLIDSQGDDIAREDFSVRERFRLAGIPCRPARVTLRLGPVSNLTVVVPQAPPARP